MSKYKYTIDSNGGPLTLASFTGGCFDSNNVSISISSGTNIIASSGVTGNTVWTIVKSNSDTSSRESTYTVNYTGGTNNCSFDAHIVQSGSTPTPTPTVVHLYARNDTTTPYFTVMGSTTKITLYNGTIINFNNNGATVAQGREISLGDILNENAENLINKRISSISIARVAQGSGTVITSSVNFSPNIVQDGDSLVLQLSAT